ncbi:MAG: M18 family aminopeptidase [Pseudomonadales bacterium]
MEVTEFNTGMLDFIHQSPTPFHAVANMAEALRAAGFQQLYETDDWQLVKGERYFLTRNSSSLIAFVMGERDIALDGLRMIGAHTDSPCLKVKPLADVKRHGYYQLGVEVYGGALLNPWFDRDLSLAGRVSFANAKKELHSCLVNFERPIAVIPSLAIHLDREANSSRSINAQKDIPPLLAVVDKDDSVNLHKLLTTQIKTTHKKLRASKVLDFELSFYDTQAPTLVGLNNDFISGARLDNLLSCYVGLQSMLGASTERSSLLVCNDHEEVGSTSASGANGPMLKNVVVRICGDPQVMMRALQNSLLVSADNAHGIHPNYADKHEMNHGPILNKGPVIKINSNQRYATNSETAAVLRNIASQVDVPLQSFVIRTDMGCGSTIGPITASELGVPTLDVGVPTFAMHSIRELAGSKDAYAMHTVLSEFMHADLHIKSAS